MRITLEGFETKNNLGRYGIQFSLHFPLFAKSVQGRMG